LDFDSERDIQDYYYFYPISYIAKENVINVLSVNNITIKLG